MGDLPQYAPGQQLAGTVYRVVRHLATGGMGSVYDVEDVTVGKRYVLKTLHPQLVSRHDLAKRMEVEARTLAKLQHPNIVDVVTAGITTDEQKMPFYVMERLNGQNLRVVIEKKGSLELSHCYRIAIDVLDALEQAHENAVIHRDVKPENIFLHRNANGTTTTKLLDFGIIRLLDAKASHTQGKFIGTLRYASPEQIFGGELGPATDIYSLGIVLYEMIAGRGPFDEVGDAYAIAAAHAQRQPPPLSRFVQIPQQLERLVMSALGKTPAERPRDCFSFAGDLRRMLRDEEAAPKSATAINVLSSVPPTKHETLSHAGTEAAPSQPTPPTDIGMPVPSMAASSPGGQPATPRMDPRGAAPAGGVGAVGPMTAMGTAPTMASEPGVRPVRDSGPPARLGSVPGARPIIDREAATHASNGLSGSTVRLAQNGTSVDDGLPPATPADLARAALAQRQALELPPTTGQSDARGRDIVFPPSHGYATGNGTGPVSGEANTRPPERGMFLPLVAAAAVGAALVGGAVLMVVKPWHPKQTQPAAATAPLPITAPTNVPAATGATDAPPPTLTPATITPLASGTIAAQPAVVTPPVPSPAPTTTGRASGSPTPRTHADVPTPASASAARKPARPAPAAAGGGAPKPEDVGFE